MHPPPKQHPRPTPANTRPRVAVSACLLGQPVRYDGRSKRNAWVVKTLSRQVEVIPLCPEMELGLGVPRPTLSLHRFSDGIHLTRSDAPDIDLTAAIQTLAQRRSAEPGCLSGIVLKSRSPSCGPRAVATSDPSGHPTGRNGTGVFAAELTTLQPLLPVIEDDQFKAATCRQFLQQVSLLHRWHQLDLDDAAAVLAFHQQVVADLPQPGDHANGPEYNPVMPRHSITQLLAILQHAQKPLDH